MKPIPFNTSAVRAILDNRKTVTRRVVKFPAGYNPKWTGYMPDGPVLYGSNNISAVKSPYRLGDILYVRETFTKYQTVNYIKRHDGRSFSEVSDGQYAYKADGYENIDDLKDDIRLLSDCSLEAVEVWDDNWHPSIHMPREAARIFLRVTDVRVERLEDMRLADFLAEGVRLTSSEEHDCIHAPLRARARYSGVWNSTIKPADLPLYGWEANPWVWVIEFEKIDRSAAVNSQKEA